MPLGACLSQLAVCVAGVFYVNAGSRVRITVLSI